MERCRYQRTILKRRCAVLAADYDLNRITAIFAAVDAFVQDLYQTRFFAYRRKQAAKPFQVGENAFRKDIRRAVDLDLIVVLSFALKALRTKDDRALQQFIE